jgi:RNA polymerase sigma factor (sigma-70 family)
MLSMHCHEERVAECLRAGAVGYLVKDGAVSEIIAAIEAAQHGEVYISTQVPTVAAKLLERKSDVTSPLQLLSPRQREILQLIAEGHSNKDIAGVLNISPGTVETHRARIMEKLDIHSVAEIVLYAVRKGIVR